MLEESVFCEDSDECKWVEPVAGKNCRAGRHCISYSITVKDGGVTKTKFFCEYRSI
jgi:hypothetical protein